MSFLKVRRRSSVVKCHLFLGSFSVFTASFATDVFTLRFSQFSSHAHRVSSPVHPCRSSASPYVQEEKV